MKKQLLFLSLIGFSLQSLAGDLVTTKSIGMELARDIASETVIQCRKQGYQVSAVVVDRHGIVRAALRDDLASRFTLQIAKEKANAVVMSGQKSGDFVKARRDIQQELNHIDGLIMMEGAIPINASGYRLGAVGVSGAPGGDKDEACAVKALAKFKEKLEFLDMD